ncbi:RING-3 protein [Plectosphaerella plurivora]|uniref:RING-3 protein n=1 Tax=Plectosphaerella plurivora TaxID=936078 RepID=A0A9P9A9X7_9PEZI|nr:RING-3 protein [Plectosphaerella plurivora]
MKQEHEDPARNPASAADEPQSPGAAKKAAQAKRTVCDHCRRRRIRCDGRFPCEQCVNASLQCRRDHVPRKRGPKRGHGRVINELRATAHDGAAIANITPADNPTEYVRRRLSSVCPPLNLDGLMSDSSADPSRNPSAASSPPGFWASLTSAPPVFDVPEPRSAFSSDEFRPRTRTYFDLIPQCLDLYYEHIYPIMPLLYMPAVRETAANPAMAPHEKNLVYALCALTAMHMSGKSIDAATPTPSWEVVGRFFLDETVAVRQSYDFLEDLSLSSVISSFYLSTSFFEINQSRKSWHYLREALNHAQDMGLQDDSTYFGLGPEETLCRQRVFWILFVTERSFAILRNKPITFKRTPSLPSTRHPYESPDIHAGFLQLVSSYTPLDESFVTAWNEGSDPRVSSSTFLALQNLLSLPPAFLRPRPPTSAYGTPADEPTDIQKADLLITQQWLRLIVWQSSMRQNLLTWTDPSDAGGGSDGSAGSSPQSPAATTAVPNNSMCFSFPLTVARDTASILASLPAKAVEVHGMGIMEKIFEIGSWCVNVLGACESVGFSTAGMDLTAGDLGLLSGHGSSGRKSASLDPIEFFVRTLSASPNSRTQFAERLLQAAGENPGCMRVALSPAVGYDAGPGTYGPMAAAAWNQRGSILGELVVAQEDEATTAAMEELDLTTSLDLATSLDAAMAGTGSMSLGSGSVDLMSPLTMTTSYTHSQGSQGFDAMGSMGSSMGSGGNVFASWSGWGEGQDGSGQPRTTAEGDVTYNGDQEGGDTERRNHGMVGVW